jgi:hypothetical protein
MELFKHCIVNTQSNLVVNVIEYEEVKTGVPPGMEDPLICVYEPSGTIGAKYENGKIINPVWPPIVVPG